MLIIDCVVYNYYIRFANQWTKSYDHNHSDMLQNHWGLNITCMVLWPHE